MKIVKVEDLHCDAGWRVNSFLKIATDEGIVGWSEYMEGYGAQGLTGVILKLAERFLIGQDPRPVERHSAHLYAATRQAAGGVNQMAIAAIENALVDIKAKSLNVPVYELLGGPMLHASDGRCRCEPMVNRLAVEANGHLDVFTAVQVDLDAVRVSAFPQDDGRLASLAGHRARDVVKDQPIKAQASFQGLPEGFAPQH